jgi:hypothetical protein
MASAAQVHANRSNARKSTGPRTSQGKAVVAQNAVRHGLLAKEAVIKGEDPGEYEFYRDRMLGELAPAGVMESVLAERIVGLSWRLRRAERLQNEAFEDLYAKETSPIARLTESLWAEGADRPAGSPERDGDPTVGRVVVQDFSAGRVLDRLLMYERRIEYSLYKTMAELRRLRILGDLAGPVEVPACRVPARVSGAPGAGFPPAQDAARMAATRTAAPAQARGTTSAPAGAAPPPVETPHHSNVPPFRHSLPRPDQTATKHELCKTKPICTGERDDGRGRRRCEEDRLRPLCEQPHVPVE